LASIRPDGGRNPEDNPSGSVNFLKANQVTSRKTPADKKKSWLENEEARAAFLHGLFMRLHNAGRLKKCGEAYRRSREELFRKGYGMSFRQFSRLVSAWGKKAHSVNNLFRRKPKPQKWGVVTEAMLKREAKRAEVIHGVFKGIEHDGHQRKLYRTYRIFGGELRKNRIFISGKTFVRMFRRWEADRSPQSLMRHRRQGHVISECDCRAVFDHAMRKGISLEDAVDCLKAIPGTQRIPSAATVRDRIPWAAPLISFGRKTNLIVMPRGAND